MYIKIWSLMFLSKYLNSLCSKENMIRNLIAPYEGRSWAQTNWILVRIWKVWNYDTLNLIFFIQYFLLFFFQNWYETQLLKFLLNIPKYLIKELRYCVWFIWQGCGFGFRYTHLSHLVPSKVQPTEFGAASLQSKWHMYCKAIQPFHLLIKSKDTLACIWMEGPIHCDWIKNAICV